MSSHIEREVLDYFELDGASKATHTDEPVVLRCGEATVAIASDRFERMWIGAFWANPSWKPGGAIGADGIHALALAAQRIGFAETAASLARFRTIVGGGQGAIEQGKGQWAPAFVKRGNAQTTHQSNQAAVAHEIAEYFEAGGER